MRQIPSVPAKLDAQLRNFLSAIREAINSNGQSIVTTTKQIEVITGQVQALSSSQTTQQDSALVSAAVVDGSAGKDARLVNLKVDAQSFVYDTNGANPSPATATFTASSANATGVVYYEFFLNDVSVQGPSTTSTYTYTPPASYTNMPQKVEVQIRESYTFNSISARDMVTVFGLKSGSHGITVELSNEAHTLYTSNANVVDYTGSGTSIIVFEGATQLVEDSSSPYSNGTFRVTATPTNVLVGTATGQGTNTLTFGNCNTMTADTASIDFAVTVKNSTGAEIVIHKLQSLSKSKQGADGLNGGLNGSRTAYLDVYQWAATQPTTFPSGTSTYTWATATFTAPGTLNGWSLTTPAPVYGQTLWLCRQTYSDTGTSTTTGVNWTASTCWAIGASGVTGQRSATLVMYKWSATAPATFPSGTSTYTWATGSYTAPATTNGWSLTVPSPVSGQSLWAIYANYTDTNTTATSTVTWSSSTPVGLSYAGMDATRNAMLQMYQWSATQPTLFPSGTSTYTWATGAFTAPTTPNGWSLTVGASVAGQTLWICQQPYIDSLTTATSTVTWSTSTAFPGGDAVQSYNALTAKIDLLQGQVGSAAASIIDNMLAVANAESQIATHLQTLESNYTTNAASTNATISNLQTTVTNGDSANATAISNLTTTVSNNYSTLNSAITNEATSRSTGDSTNATAITNLTSVVNGKNTIYRQGTAPSSPVTGDLWFDTSNNNLVKRWDGSAWVDTTDARLPTVVSDLSTEQTTRATADSALSTSITNLTTTVTNNYTTLNSAISSESTTRATQDTALATKIDLLQAAASDNAGRISDLQSVVATADAVIAQRIQSIESSQVTGAITTNAAINSLQSAMTTADTANATAITNLTTTVSNNYTTLNSAITNETSARTTGDSTNATAISNLTSTVNNNYITLDSAITNEATTRSTGDTTNANAITSLTSTVNNNYTTLNSAITTESNTRASYDTVLATKVDLLQATYGDVSAKVEDTVSVVASLTNALAGKTTSLETTLNGYTSKITQTMQSVDGIKANYGVTINNNGAISGFALNSDLAANGRTPTTAFIISADKFAVVDPGTNVVGVTTPSTANCPFLISGGVTYIKEANIADLTVGTNLIKNGAVSDVYTYEASTLTLSYTTTLSSSVTNSSVASVTVAAAARTQQHLIFITLDSHFYDGTSGYFVIQLKRNGSFLKQWVSNTIQQLTPVSGVNIGWDLFSATYVTTSILNTSATYTVDILVWNGDTASYQWNSAPVLDSRTLIAYVDKAQ